MMFQINKPITVCVLLLASITVAANDGYKKILKRYMSNTYSLEAKYVQTVYDKNRKKVSSSHGSMMYKRPNLFRFQDDVSHQLMVNDGAYFWQYEPDLDQVIKYKTPEKSNNGPVSYTHLTLPTKRIV